MREPISIFFKDKAKSLAHLTKETIEGQKPSIKNILSRAFIGKLEGKKVSFKDLLLEGKEIVSQHGQWTSIVNEKSYEKKNLGPDGLERFYTEVQGMYGNPLFIIERDRAFDLPEELKYVNAKNEPTDYKKMIYKYKDLEGKEVAAQHKIGGIICQSDEPHKDDPRSSLSNPNFIEIANSDSLGDKQFQDAKGVSITYWHKTNDGIKTFQNIGGERLDRNWFLSTLFLKDKNRFGNYDAYYSLNKPKEVKILELADINFNKFM